MRVKLKPLVVSVALILSTGLLSASVHAVSKGELEQRLLRIERLLDSQSLVQLLTELQQLTREVQAMRGDLEQQDHSLSQIKKRQRDLYLDIDRRLRQLELGGIAGPAVPVAPGAASVPDTAAVTSSPGAATPAVPADRADGPEVEADYQKAFRLLKEGRYESAISSFQAFLQTWPQSSYADNAQYWLGEAYYVTRRFKLAVSEFEKLVALFPQSQKLTHAKLKIGYIYHELGDHGRAKQVLTRLRSTHPGTTAARLAEERLQRMRIEERR